jgi:DNA-binding transcriptional LysR family regulator
VHGQTIFTNGYHMAKAAASGCGLAFVTEDLAAPYLADGRLVPVMQDWCPKFPGLHAYYPSRRHTSRALSLIIDTIRLADPI